MYHISLLLVLACVSITRNNIRLGPTLIIEGVACEAGELGVASENGRIEGSSNMPVPWIPPFELGILGLSFFLDRKPSSH